MRVNANSMSVKISSGREKKTIHCVSKKGSTLKRYSSKLYDTIRYDRRD